MVLDRNRTRPLRAALLALCLGALLWLPAGALALDVEFQTSGDTDVVYVVFDGGQVPTYSVKRTGKQSVVVSVPGASPMAKAKPVTGRMVTSIEPTADGLSIVLSTDAFGYISIPVVGQPRLQIQFFRDPIGAKWQDPAAPAPQPTPAPQPAPAPEQPAPEQPAPEQPAPEQPATEQPVPEQPVTGQPVPEQPVPDQPVAEQPVPEAPTPQAPVIENGPFQQNFYNVPYAVRAPVGTGGSVQVAPAQVTGEDNATGEVRYKAVKAGPEEMLRPVPVEEAAAQPAEPESTYVSPPEGVVQAPVSEAPGQEQGQTSAPAQPAPEQPVAEQPAPEQPAPEQPAPEQPAPEQPAPEQPAAELPGPEQPVAETPPSGKDHQLDAQADARASEVVGATTVDNAEEGPKSADQMTEEEKHIQGLELNLLKAQSQIATGDLNGARSALENILKDPLLPDKLREEALYSLAGILATIYQDSMAEHFDEVQSAYMEALNANLESDRVPDALFQLGRINLRVNNLPEAEAYFGLLKEKYPYNENIPAIGFHWGEYWFRQGDYQKAADAFQNFIETYPENERLARQSAYLLAQSLERLGLYDQAFQIVDYIDKRWPQAYEENPGFLKLAGDIEYRLGLYDMAKDDYWTYYNMNPKAEQADVVLARLGDTYLEKGKRKAAKDLYQRAIRDYEGMEGALIAKMRLAEEGIYDEPTFLDMVTVFDRPYNKRPLEVYTEIVEQHPDSPLAPLALLKMGMWHYYQKEYPLALEAARRLLDEYPRSELVDRAKELADRTFALAVPGLIDQGDYAKVVAYWENYDFSKHRDAVDDATKIAVAQSYYKLNDYTKAMDMLTPYLTQEQVPEYSDLALGLALNIYLDQQAWTRIGELSDMVHKNWTVNDRMERLLNHANAVAYENLGETDKAVRLWALLGADPEVEDFIRADSLYYLAKEAMNHQDLKRVFVYSQEAIALLAQTGGDREKIKDSILMSVYATERSGRYQEALKWVNEYVRMVPEGDPEWSASRYKLAQILYKVGATKDWADTLNEILEKEPDSLYGRLAATALETQRIEDQAQQYAPVPN